MQVSWGSASVITHRVVWHSSLLMKIALCAELPRILESFWVLLEHDSFLSHLSWSLR
uniref:Inositol-tetrakisphosphate 1-kinase 3-like isoform X2 n=1 Tax=Rhizophora mucronata TaxID=61149 RepID=A0A2P2MJ91_RHIMU